MSALSLIIGIIVGAAAASAAWFAVGAVKGKKLEEQKRAKEEVMTSIGELLADADAYEAGYRCGAVTADSFSRGLIDRVNAISRPLRTNMHILDVFFVKYAEQQVDEYMRMIENPERRAEARKSVHRAVSEWVDEPGSETGLGITPAAVTPIAERQEEAAPNYEEQDIFDAGIGQEETFAPLSPPETDSYESAFELPEAEAENVAAPEPEVVFEDADAEEETPPEEQVFGEGPASGNEEAAGGSWLDKSLEEFEAGFARFEPQAAAPEEPPMPKEAEFETGFARFEAQDPAAEEFAVSEEVEAEAWQAEPSAEFGRETGDFVASGPDEPPEPVVEEPEPEPEPIPVPEDGDEDIFDVQVLPFTDPERTETQQFDKPMAMEAAAGHAFPSMTAEKEPQAEEAGRKPAAEHDGITGDDVSTAIDNFFKL